MLTSQRDDQAYQYQAAHGRKRHGPHHLGARFSGLLCALGSLKDALGVGKCGLYVGDSGLCILDGVLIHDTLFQFGWSNATLVATAIGTTPSSCHTRDSSQLRAC